MNNRQLASALGLSPNTTKKWHAEKKARLIREIESGVNHEVKRLIGELAQLCYAVQCKTVEPCTFEVWSEHFDVWHKGEFIFNSSPLNALALQGAIAKLEAILNA